ncbi:MAG: DUF2085 domain-containing protein [Verrucomicrobiota bacterium]|jgi:hypothetical protein
MLEFLGHWFGLLCGQDPDHTWAPGGLLLPCCQRCLGLYVGAGIAACLHWRLRPSLSGRFLETHGLFLLLMAPLGFHWLPQGPVPRTVSGVLFGFGVATFLWLPVSAWAASTIFAPRRGTRHRAELTQAQSQCAHPRAFPAPSCRYAIALAATLVLTPLLAALGGTPAAYALSGLALGGAAALALLTLANTALFLSGAIHLHRRLKPPSAWQGTSETRQPGNFAAR